MISLFFLAAANDAVDQAAQARIASVADVVFVSGERIMVDEDATRTATKTLTPLLDTPQAITVIDESFIEDAAMRSMADVLRYTPGATMGQGEGHRDAPTLRGNSSTADFFVDGVRDDVQYYRDLYNAERIEILKGPNAMIFGRGGGGGVINRVTKRADGERVRDLSISGGSLGDARATFDIGGAASERLALRVNGFYENADSYRDYAGLERYGFNPTASLAIADDTDISLSYERVSDDRTVDRGVPSVNGLPFDGDRSAFFGDPRASYSTSDVDVAALTVEHRVTPALTLRNKTLFADYRKFYQNVYPGSSVGASGDVSLSAYSSGLDRQNFFNQTDISFEGDFAGIEHILLVGMEFGSQDTLNTRSQTIAAGIVNITSPAQFGASLVLPPQSDNRVTLDIAAFYAQEQVSLTPWLDVIAGVRFDRFDLKFEDNLTPQTLRRQDDIVSPRGGLVLKPAQNLSFYASYAQSFLPQSGDQFGSLSATTAALEPEEFENIEVGAKWRLLEALDVSLAAYRLDRENTRALDPITSVTVLTGAQRSKGVELSVSGEVTRQLSFVAAAAFQESEIVRATTAAPAGRQAPLTPERSFSIWARYQPLERIGAAIGVSHASDQFASISNAVTLDGYTRIDAALYLSVTDRFQAQLNVENALDSLFFPTAHSDNNITPAAPRVFRATLSAAF